MSVLKFEPLSQARTQRTTVVLKPQGQTYLEVKNKKALRALKKAKAFVVCECDEMTITTKPDGYEVDVVGFGQPHVMAFVSWLLGNETNFGLCIVTEDRVNMLAIMASDMAQMNRWTSSWLASQAA